MTGWSVHTPSLPLSPSGGDVVCEGGRGADLSGEAEVGDLDDVGPHAEQVLRLHVAVEVAVFVHEGQALQNLIERRREK